MAETNEEAIGLALLVGACSIAVSEVTSLSLGETFLSLTGGLLAGTTELSTQFVTNLFSSSVPTGAIPTVVASAEPVMTGAEALGLTPVVGLAFATVAGSVGLGAKFSN